MSHSDKYQVLLTTISTMYRCPKHKTCVNLFDFSCQDHSRSNLVIQFRFYIYEFLLMLYYGSPLVSGVVYKIIWLPPLKVIWLSPFKSIWLPPLKRIWRPPLKVIWLTLLKSIWLPPFKRGLAVAQWLGGWI